MSDLVWREFRIEKAKKTQVWKIALDGQKYWTQSGQLDGKMQEFSDIPGPKGKEGTKAYVTAEDNSKFHADREIRKKTEAGYIEIIDGKPVSEKVTSIDFSKPLPKNFSSYKPKTSIEDKALVKLHEAGRAKYSRKWDGQRSSIVHHSYGWRIYSRRMDDISERFPHHIKLLSNINFEVGTIFEGEFICYSNKEPGKEDFKAISSFLRSLPDQARKLVEDKKVTEPTFIIFDCIYLNGKDLKDKTYKDRISIWNDVFDPVQVGKEALIASVDYHDVTPHTWMKVAQENGWEGFVINDLEAIPGEKFFSFDGKPDRFNGTHKLKVVHSEDVVIFAALSGGGKRLGGIGALCLKQIHPETGKWFYCGNVGSGPTEKDLEQLESLFKTNGLQIFEKEKDVLKLDIENEEGIVCTIEYSDRQPGTSKFKLPVFLHVRDDKPVKECVAQKLGEAEDDDE